MEIVDITKEKCGFCDKHFKEKEGYYNYGSTSENNVQEKYLVHDSCAQKAMQEYRDNKELKS